MTLTLRFPEESVGQLEGWAGEGRAPVDIGPARGVVAVDFPHAILEVSAETTDLSFLSDVGDELHGVHLVGEVWTSADLEVLPSVPGLQNVALNGRNLDGNALPILSRISSLTALHLSGDAFELADLAAARLHLRHFSLGRPGTATGSEDDEAAISCMQQWEGLTGIALTGLNLTDAIFPAAAELQDLELLLLHSCAITGVGAGALAHAKSLRRLSLHATQIDDAAVPELCELAQLEKLGITRTLVTDASVEQLLASPIPHVALRGTAVSYENLKLFKERAEAAGFAYWMPPDPNAPVVEPFKLTD